MSKEDTHAIRNATVAAVLAGLILSAIPHTRRFIVVVLMGTWSFLSSFSFKLWRYSWSRVSVPWVLVWLLIFAALPTLWRFLKRFLPHETGPKKTDYISDSFFGVHWTWSYGWRDEPSDIAPFCPMCSTRLVYMMDPFDGPTVLHCETCSRNIRKMKGKPHFIQGTIARQIERRLNSGEWKQVVETDAISVK